MATLLQLLEVMQADIAGAKVRVTRIEMSRRSGRRGKYASLYPDKCGIPCDGVADHHMLFHEGDGTSRTRIPEEEWE